jgi:hypothetical protein
MKPLVVRSWLLPSLSSVLIAACASNPPPPAASPASAAPPAPGPSATTVRTAAPAIPTAVRSASDILADSIKAVGAPDAWNGHKSVHMTMTMTFQAVGITGTAQRFATAGDKSLVVTEIPGVGLIREGSNGKVFWSQDPINGLRMLDGAEADQARIESVWNPELRVNELFAKVESKNETGADGKVLECVVLTPKVAPPSTRCFDPASHLQVTEKGVRPTPQGDTPFTSTVSDWRTVGGLKMAYALETQAGPITFSAKVQSVVFDQTMDDKQFEPPQPTAVAPADAPAASSSGKSKAKGETKTKAKAKTGTGKSPPAPTK